jgi:hypothetical protein
MKATDYCKVQMMKHQWDVKHYTNVYEDTWRFEHRLDAQSFIAHWESKFVNQ